MEKWLIFLVANGLKQQHKHKGYIQTLNKNINYPTTENE